LAVGLLVTDRGAKLAIERVAAGRMQSDLSTTKHPSVDLGGFPFLPDLIRGKFSHVTVDLVGASGGRVTLEHVHADLHGVRQIDHGVHAEQISGEGMIGYDALSAAAAPLRVGYGGAGLIQITAEVTGLGRQLEASASGRPRIEGNTLIVKPQRASTSVNGDVGAAAAAVPEIRIPLRRIPPNLAIVLRPSAAGVVFTFSGSDVVLTAGKAVGAFGGFPVELGVLLRPLEGSRHETLVSFTETFFRPGRTAT